MRRTLVLVMALGLGGGSAGCGGRRGGGNALDGGTESGLPDGVTPDRTTGDTPVGTDRPTPDGGTEYSETLCSLTDLSAVRAAHTPSSRRTTLEGIAELRYPFGLAALDAQEDTYLETWCSGSTFDAMLDCFETAVHEGLHFWDFENSDFSTHPFRVRDDLIIATRRLDNFNRGEILTLHVNVSADRYADVYLTGESGAQGFTILLDEYNAYAHSLASKYCTRDALGGSATSARDGILTMMYYVELYLKLARTTYPADYAEILADPGHVDAILTIWDRAEFWLDVTSTNPELGISDDTIATWTYDPSNLMEIDLVRAEL